MRSQAKALLACEQMPELHTKQANLQARSYEGF